MNVDDTGATMIPLETDVKRIPVYKYKKLGRPSAGDEPDIVAYELVDDEDYELQSQSRWFLSSENYVFRKMSVNKKQLWVSLHSEILQPTEGKMVDHINHDTLDNRRENLRPATPMENGRNKRPFAKSGVKGAYPQGRGWASAIWMGTRKVYLGMFDTAEEAGARYDEEARKLHGEFAYTNADAREAQ